MASNRPGDSPELVRTVDDEEPYVAEKPYIIAEGGEGQGEGGGERYSLVVPGPRTDGGRGGKGIRGGRPDDPPSSEEVRSFDRVRLVLPHHDHDSVQGALDSGLDLVVSPGVYRLGKTLGVRHGGTVVLGLGMATLVAPQDGSPAIRVEGRTPGVRIAGLILEASVQSSYPSAEGSEPESALLIWGDDRDPTGAAAPYRPDPGDPRDPGVVSDVFCRVGGTAGDDGVDESRNASVGTMMIVRSGNVILDDVWLWRPDHLASRVEEEVPTDPPTSEYYLVGTDDCSCRGGLRVTGDNVTAYGLSVEHVGGGDQVRWEGERGRVRFYQSELPYDVVAPPDGGDRGDKGNGGGEGEREGGYVSWSIHESVRTFDLKGGGVYSFFRDHDIVADTAFRYPVVQKDGRSGTTDVNLTNVFTRFLDGRGGIRHIINTQGDAVNDTHRLSRVAEAFWRA